MEQRDLLRKTMQTENNIPFVDPANIKLATPTITKMTNTVSGVHVYWNTVPNATAYTVYRQLRKMEHIRELHL